MSFTFPDKDLKPNAHPYAIKTTSTALLSRSNSSPHNANHARHYVPNSPSPTRTRQKSISTNPDNHGHRYSRSMSSDVPRPLPTPPQLSPSPTSSKFLSHTDLPSFSLEDLPVNPRHWTPSQLAAYLSTALRLKSGESLDLPAPVAADIAAFVRDRKITGKIFLRFNEADLDSYGINKPWQTALLIASRNLRQNVLKGQIWGFGNSLQDSPHSPTTPDEDDDGTPSNRRRSNSHSYQSNPFVNGSAFYASDSSSSSMEDLSQSPTGRYRNGRVQGMVQSFERSSSLDDGHPQHTRERSGSSASGSSGLDDDEAPRKSVFRTARQLPIPPPFIPHLEEEFTIEELLAKSQHQPMPEPFLTQKQRRGVHAWEADDGAGLTVKRVADGSNGRSTDDVPTSVRPVHDIFSPNKVDIGISAQATPEKPAGDGEEARLKAEIDNTRALLEEFKKRLVFVEEKIAEMENNQRKPDESETAEKVALSPTTSYIKAISGMFGSDSTREEGDKQVSPYDRLFNPKTISALPSYLVLISLGVCAVVFKVVLKRTLGIAINRRK